MAAKTSEVTTRAETAVNEQQEGSISQRAVAAMSVGSLAIDAFANGSIIIDGIEIAVARYDEDDPERCCHQLERAIEELAYDALSDLHGGWENNDGAYGEFVFDTAKRSISLAYYERYTATEDYDHEL